MPKMDPEYKRVAELELKSVARACAIFVLQKEYLTNTHDVQGHSVELRFTLSTSTSDYQDLWYDCNLNISRKIPDQKELQRQSTGTGISETAKALIAKIRDKYPNLKSFDPDALTETIRGPLRTDDQRWASAVAQNYGINPTHGTYTVRLSRQAMVYADINVTATSSEEAQAKALKEAPSNNGHYYFSWRVENAKPNAKDLHVDRVVKG